MRNRPREWISLVDTYSAVCKLNLKHLPKKNLVNNGNRRISRSNSPKIDFFGRTLVVDQRTTNTTEATMAAKRPTNSNSSQPTSAEHKAEMGNYALWSTLKWREICSLLWVFMAKRPCPIRGATSHDSQIKKGVFAAASLRGAAGPHLISEPKDTRRPAK